MLKKDITYTDFDEEEHTETFYFNLSKSELAQIALESSAEGTDVTESLRSLIASNDPKKIIPAFKNVIGMTVGIRSEDGKTFKKSPEISEDFLNSPAFDSLFMELITDPKAATEFITGAIPKDLREQAVAEVNLPQEELPWANREPTQAELASMTPEQMRDAFARRLGTNQ